MNGIQTYQQNTVTTASPERLLIMLYEGIAKFSKQASQAIINKKYDDASKFISKAQAIIMELKITLKVELAPELCGNLLSLYDFMYSRLIDANLKKDTQPLVEVIKLALEFKETFELAAIKNKMDRR